MADSSRMKQLSMEAAQSTRAGFRAGTVFVAAAITIILSGKALGSIDNLILTAVLMLTGTVLCIRNRKRDVYYHVRSMEINKLEAEFVESERADRYVYLGHTHLILMAVDGLHAEEYKNIGKMTVYTKTSFVMTDYFYIVNTKKDRNIKVFAGRSDTDMHNCCSETLEVIRTRIIQTS